MDIEFVRDASVLVGDNLDDATDFQLALGPAGEVYREAGDEAEAKHEDIETALNAVMADYVTGEGVVMDSSSWKVAARNPE